MEIVLVVIAFALLITGIIGAFVPFVPGLPLSFLGLLLMQWSGYGGFSANFLLIWAGITLALTLMDFLLPSLMAKWFGGSRAAALGSFLGIVAGIFFFPPMGILIGPFLGALIGELIHNSSNGIKALKVALGAFLAFIIGSGAKLVASSIMAFYAVKAFFT